MIEIRANGLDDAIKNAKVLPKELDKTLSGIVKHGAVRLLREFKKQLAGRAVNRVSGRFISSANMNILDNFNAAVGSDFVGARVREFGTEGLPGGALTPKNRKFMAIPLPDAMTASGVAKPTSAFPDTFVLQSKALGLHVAHQPVVDEDPKPLFLLRTRVTQKAQRPLAIAEKIATPLILREAEKRLKKLTDGSN